ncbi:putative hydrolase of the HAD superfamily [Geothermobacter ehrlichii]|uniref:Putative hydrolase of the HAD superfamily n=1 Tax=Geothermobacter ehrlichii TaxID=213224 RepID=A0A5D3WMJ9_9BACT|nr:pyrimidine 5'-nucleotidase [Geothermobacter ehrlichii]TYO99306.1 putative hydrolase of the HAD superfamily [Geothermobacter ehrlichii]
MKAVLFDLDNTLYPPERDLFSLIDVRINRYMEEVVGIAAAEVDGLRRRYWRDYGATLQGLVRHYAVDPEDYLHYVHDVDVGSRLRPDPVLRDTLAALLLPRYVFTNGSSDHAERVLAALGLEDVFAGIFDIRIANYQPKPNRDPYEEVLQSLGLQAGQCIMVEDSLDNLHTAKKLGMATVLVGEGPAAAHVDHHAPDVCSAARAVDDLSRRAGGWS